MPHYSWVAMCPTPSPNSTSPPGKSGKPHQQQTVLGAGQIGGAGEIRRGIHGEGGAAELLEGKVRLLEVGGKKGKEDEARKVPGLCSGRSLKM